LSRFIERFGALFLSLSVTVAFLLGLIEGEPPDVSEKTADEVVAHWVDLGDGAWLGVWLGMIVGLLALFGGLWVANALRERGATILAPGAALGTIFIAVGISVDAASRVALLDAAEHMPVAAVVAVSAMLQYLWLPFLLGMVLMTVSVSASAKQTGLIPSWLAWIGYATALIFVIPHWVSFLGFMVFIPWMIIAGIVMFRRTSAST